jgi:hypothetical protein
LRPTSLPAAHLHLSLFSLSPSHRQVGPTIRVTPNLRPPLSPGHGRPSPPLPDAIPSPALLPLPSTSGEFNAHSHAHVPPRPFPSRHHRIELPPTLMAISHRPFPHRLARPLLYPLSAL